MPPLYELGYYVWNDDKNFFFCQVNEKYRGTWEGKSAEQKEGQRPNKFSNHNYF